MDDLAIPMLRTMNGKGNAFASPAEVPQRVDDAALAATLRAGHPVGEAGVNSLEQISFPAVSAAAASSGAHGAPLLLVHGLGHDMSDWATLFVRCNRSARTAIDLPGFGLTDKPARDYPLALLVDAVLLAAEGLGRPVVVASSLGGHVAMLAALKRPDAFSRLVLLAPGGFVVAAPAMQAMLRAYYSVDSICGRSDDEIVANSRRIFAKPGHPKDDLIAARKLAIHRSSRRREFAVPFSSVVDDVFRHPVPVERLRALDLPTLIISGERDVVVPPDACADAARRLGARFVAMPGVGHCPHIEADDDVAALVTDFSSSSSPTSTSTSAARSTGGAR